MKRVSQARDRQLVASGAIVPEAMFFIRPYQLRNVRIEWPNVSLNDDQPEPQ
jgi:hypothetical protein